MKNLLLALFAFVGLNSFAADIDTVYIKTSAVCDMCEDRIEEHLRFTKGVKEVDLDIKSKVVMVIFKSEKTSAQKLREEIASLGYNADNVAANEKAYHTLPGCCQKEGVCKHGHGHKHKH